MNNLFITFLLVCMFSMLTSRVHVSYIALSSVSYLEVPTLAQYNGLGRIHNIGIETDVFVCSLFMGLLLIMVIIHFRAVALH